MTTWRLTHHSLVPQNAGFVLGHHDGLIQWLEVGPMPAILTGDVIPNPGALLTALQAVGNASFAITINGTAQELEPMDMTGINTLADAAAMIADEMTGATCEYQSGMFVIETDAKGASATLSYASAPADGADISTGLRLTSTTASSLVQGSG
jgi:hypothetical protein